MNILYHIHTVIWSALALYRCSFRCRKSVSIYEARPIGLHRKYGVIMQLQKIFRIGISVVTYIFTSSKKHFMKNVKECRDVNRQKSIRTRSGCYRHTAHTLDPYIAPSES